MGDKSRLENNNLILQNITNTVMNMPDYVEIKNQDINVTENGLYTANTGYTGLGAVTVNVSGGEGDIKQFDSIANMQADPNPTEGDLAIVYYSTGGNLTAETEFQVANFPETVTLPSAVTDYIDVQFKAVDESIMFDCRGNISSDRFSMSCYMDDGDIRIEYTSSDGINYTRSRFMKNQEEISGTEMDFGTTIIFGSRWGELTWDDAVGYFIQVGVTEFNGLYQYTNNSYSLAPTQFTANNRYVFNKSFYGVNGADTGTLQNVENLTLDEVKFKTQVFSDLSYLTPSNDITDMSKMFWNYNDLITIPNLYTTKVTNTSNMFWSCDNLISVPNFDTSNVTDMSNMFWSCSNLIDVPEFNTSNVISMDNMFIPCVNLSDISIQNIINSTPESTQINRKLFANICYNVDRLNSEQKDVLFNKGYLDCDQNTTGWSTQYNFYNGIGWSTIDRGSNFDRYGKTLRIQMNTKLNNSALRDIQLMSIGDDNGILLSMDKTFTGSYSKFNIMNSCNVIINTSNVVSTHSMFSDCQNLTSVSNFNTSNVIDASWMFLGCYKLTTVPNFNTSNAINMSSMFGSCTSLTTIPNFNTSNVIDMSYMFVRCNNLTNIPNFDTSNVITMYQTFYYCHNLTTIPNLDTSNVTNMVCMFQTCNKLISIPNLNTSNVTNMVYMFQYCRNIVTIPNLDTSNVTNMAEMFSDCDNLMNVPILNTNNVTNMSKMFFLCHNLTSVPNYNTSNVTNMSGMFQACNSLTAIPEFDTSNVTDMTRMFYDCYNLTTIPNLDTSNITNMTVVFRGCRNLATVPNLDLHNVEIATELFSQCNSLITVPNFDLSNAKTTAWMFYDCQNLTNIPNFNISNVTNMQYMFYNCRKLTSIPNFDTSNVTVIGQVFSNCVNLTTVPELNSMKFTSMSAMFADCNNLSNESIQNIVNMCLNSNITDSTWKNLSNTNSFGPLYNTKFDNSYYQNRWAELDAAGWTY